MRISIDHTTRYVYQAPVRYSTQYLRLVPRSTSRQRVVQWRLDTPATPLELLDGYGNILHVLTIIRPINEIAFSETPRGTTTVAGSPSSLAIRATARPWLPSVAVTSLGCPRSARRSCSARWTAHDAPSILNAGSPSREDSSLTSTARTFDAAATVGNETNGVSA